MKYLNFEKKYLKYEHMLTMNIHMHWNKTQTLHFELCCSENLCFSIVMYIMEDREKMNMINEENIQKRAKEQW